MARQLGRVSALVAAGFGLMALNGCSRSPPEEYGAPPPPNMNTRGPPPELAGGPPPPAGMAPPPMAVESGALPPVDGGMAPVPNPPGARAEAGPPLPPPGYVPNPSFAPPPPGSAQSYASGPVEVVAMRPIPNPEDLSPAERRRVYGPGRNYSVAPAPVQRSARSEDYSPAPRRPAPRRQASSSYTPPPMIRPEPARPVARAPARPAPVARPPAARPAAPMAQAPAVRPPVAKALPPSAAARQAAAPVKPEPVSPSVAAKRPVPTPPPGAGQPTTAQGKLGQLQAAVGGAVARGATLTVGPEIAKGQPGQVSLSLPATLMETLKAEAAKLGLSRPARKAEVEATLTGDGYTVTPNGRQSAALKAGEAARFDWQVAPSAQSTGPLQADVNAVLAGQGKRQTLTLASIQSAVAATALEAEKKSGFEFKMPRLPNLPFFGKKDSADAAGPPPAPDVVGAPPVAGGQPMLRERTLPVVGRVSGRTQAAMVLAALAVLILALVSRNMAGNRRLAERRRRYRTYQPMGMEERPAEI